MNTCLAHPDIPSIASCSTCTADLCESCEVRAHGASWCEACFAASVQAPAAPPPPPPGLFTPPLKSGALAALLSFIVPGLGTIYVYNGPAKRGLVQFGVWAFLLWVISNAGGLFFAVSFFAFLGFYLWQAIDAAASARWVNALGRMPTEDEAEAAGRGAYILQGADTRSLGTALLVVGCVLLLIEMGGVLAQGLRWLGPFALLVLGAVILVRARRRQPQPMAGDQGGLA